MNVALTPETQKYVEQKLQSGRYQSANEAVNSLLTLARHQEEFDPEGLEDLRTEVDAGINDADQGRFASFTAKDIIAEGQKPMRG